jgi:aldehyde dehydrogenase (NAD+)
MRYAGQKCTATSRVIIDRKVEDEFYDALKTQVAGLALGPVTDASAAVGPLISSATLQSIRAVLAADHAERVYEGTVPNTPEFANGFFMPPMVLRGAAPDSALAQQELFGPVLASFVADDLDHALALANDTPYGLSASLFTHDIRHLLTYMHRIEVGLVRVNGDTTGVDPHAPFGGVKGSSSGSREQGPAAREFYTEIRTVQVNP